MNLAFLWSPIFLNFRHYVEVGWRRHASAALSLAETIRRIRRLGGWTDHRRSGRGAQGENCRRNRESSPVFPVIEPVV